MITNTQKAKVIETLIELVELPESAYEKAKNRYDDLGQWLERPKSTILNYSPHIFPQGSFRLGTAIRPLDQSEEDDLDLACKLRSEISKNSHTQHELRQLVGKELESYRQARGIQKDLAEKHRCWRLEYQDTTSFHMDIVPCIPEEEHNQILMSNAMRHFGLDDALAEEASKTAIAITDDRHEGYRTLCDEWNISNPEGYAKWFEYRMNPQQRTILLDHAQVDEVPLYKKKMPLQRVIQILKRHRDNWCKNNPNVKPISIIITTLAARAYEGEGDILAALGNILQRMSFHVLPTTPRIPNPVDPNEDFADRWYHPDSAHLRLEQNFNLWLEQARRDFHFLTSSDNTVFLSEQFEEKLSLTIDESELRKRLGMNTSQVSILTPKAHSISKEESTRPWNS